MDRRSWDILKHQGGIALGETAGVVGLRWVRPAARGWRLIRTVGRLGLFADASSRLYFVVGEGVDPGVIALPRAASQVLPHVWDRVMNQLVVTGYKRLPSAYTERFYQGAPR